MEDSSLESSETSGSVPPTPLCEKILDVSNKQKPWYDRTQYAQMLREIIVTQITQYMQENDRIKKTRIAQNIGYLVQVLGSLVNSEKQLDERIQRLEEMMSMKRLKG